MEDGFEKVFRDIDKMLDFCCTCMIGSLIFMAVGIVGTVLYCIFL